MRHSATSLAPAALMALASGCALGDGEPWGVVQLAATVDFAPPASRLDDQQRLKTAADYRVEIEQISVEGREIRLPFATANASGFDPADPPEGYSLCHNGHCHSDNGALVDYATIAAELATSGGGPAIVVAIEGEVALTDVPTALAVAGCDDGCLAPRGELDTAVVTFASIRVRGTAFDARTGDDARLGPEGVVFDFTTTESVSVVGQLDGAETFGPGARNDITMTIELSASDRILDNIDFSLLLPNEPFATAAISEAFSQSTMLVQAHHNLED